MSAHLVLGRLAPGPARGDQTMIDFRAIEFTIGSHHHP